MSAEVKPAGKLLKLNVTRETVLWLTFWPFTLYCTLSWPLF